MSLDGIERLEAMFQAASDIASGEDPGREEESGDETTRHEDDDIPLNISRMKVNLKMRMIGMSSKVEKYPRHQHFLAK